MAKDSNKQPSPIKSSIRHRVQILYLVMVAVGIAILGKILYIQFGPNGEELRQKGEATSFNLFRVEGTRGDIYSKDMELIATSQKRYMVGIDFGASGFAQSGWSKNLPLLSRQLAEMFGGDAESYKRRLSRAWADYKSNPRHRYVRVTPRWVNQRERDKVRTFAQLNLKPNIGGRSEEEEIERVQPFGKAASRTIGKTRSDLVEVKNPEDSNKTYSVYSVHPTSGLEFSFNEHLQGTAGWQMRQKINRNFWSPVDSPYNVEPQDGCDVVTTLDMDVQDIAESMLEEQILKNTADWGCVAVMEVATGDLRAMANLTRFEDRCVEDRNYLVGRYEPGSTIKLVSLLSLLELGGMELTDSVDVESGVAVIDGRTYKDDHGGYKMISVKDMFAQSSNIGFIKAVREEFRSNPQRYIDFCGELGLREPLGISLNGEAKPLMWSPEDKGANQWIQNLTLNKMAYGYGFEISPLHTLTVFNAVANGGVMVRPRLVTAITRYGEELESFPVEYINKRICSGGTIAKARECLESVVDSGTGRALQNPYYTAAAKTGTAQMLFTDGTAAAGNPYTDVKGRRQYLATMVGYFPADNPQYSIIVCIKSYTGRNWNYYGAGLAGPVFKAVADRLYAKHTEWQPTVEHKIKNDTIEHIATPARIKHGHYDDVRKVAGKLDIKLRDDAAVEEWVRLQSDSAGVAIKDMKTTENLVPNVIGMGAKDALYLLESAGLRASIEGRGTVVRQSPASGTRATRGATVTLTLK